MDWNPENYTKGNYFQNETSEDFRKSFEVKPFGRILDVGCGDGQYSRFLADHLKNGHMIGIDSSAEMIKHANHHWACKTLTFEQHNIEHYQPAKQFDFILSFWCLHWTDISLSFPNMYHALTEGGRIYALFSSFSSNSIYKTCYELASQHRYQFLTERYINSSNEYQNYFYHVLNTLIKLPFKRLKLNLKTTYVYFPDISYFKNLLLTLPFIKTFPPNEVDAIIEDLLEVFQKHCNRHYGGKLYYETRPIYLEAIK
ncbi:class I SAM-dependent methyltransferase [Legionella bononiensis]|uniref:Class I SAM-dependent methyltransferase n=1 Tax=Legionella bononiensis TaxID=2793102 RepID=A0ABS1WDH8_9GAMM|nr:class I SAM-dependent methyltransferase [Legionella bononiensis]MBL7481219.1 class I SAM-dependent methyltransferase [Legionella bononiensis]MBL7527325.1 class I SAM-dependent methyltransferase [Legionella bononiensis]MBL7562294.1 class I SAM-dependent methyltransferase [Legionella bononiensis]